MVNKCLDAYTETLDMVQLGEYVGYMNISRLDNGNVRLIVRQRGKGKPPECTLDIPADVARRIFHGA